MKEHGEGGADEKGLESKLRSQLCTRFYPGERTSSRIRPHLFKCRIRALESLLLQFQHQCYEEASILPDCPYLLFLFEKLYSTNS